MEANFTKAEKKIKMLSEKVGCTEDGQLWMKQALDPFNDEPRRAVGYPDLEIGSSVIQVIKQTATYTVGATAEDVHMFMDTVDIPFLVYENTNLTQPTSPFGAISNNYVIDNLATLPRKRGGFVVSKGAVGSTYANMTDVLGVDISLQETYVSTGAVRVLAKAFEVHNVTPTLTVGGSVCVYRSPADIPYNKPETMTLRNLANPNTLFSSYTGHVLSHVPNTLGEAMLFSGSQQWAAKDGCYVVAVSGAQTNEVSDGNQLVYRSTNGLTAGKTYVNSFQQNAAWYPVPNTTGPTGGTGNVNSPFYFCGAYFSGLPAGSILTINTIYYIERFVDSRNKDLIVLTQPSPFYDPVALELYSRSAQRLPVGTKVKNNADGDWIKTVADVLGSFGVPGMPIVKGAVDLWNGYNRASDANLGSRVERRLNGVTSGQAYRPLPSRPQQRKIPPFTGRMPALPPIPSGSGAKKKQKKKNNKKKQS